MAEVLDVREQLFQLIDDQQEGTTLVAARAQRMLQRGERLVPGRITATPR